MKKGLMAVLACLLLTGCGEKAVFETLGDVQHDSEQVMAMAQMQLSVPEDAAAQTFGDGTLYECEGYTLFVQTFSSGDLQRTVKTLSGFSTDKLTVLETQVGEVMRYEWVWTAAAEDGDMLCRATVLDDGKYHYCVTALAPAKEAGSLNSSWNQLFGSFALE